MSKVQTLRGLINQRLTSAAEEIFELFERTISEYEEQLSRSKEENGRQKKLLDAVFNPQLLLKRSEVQKLMLNQEEVPTEEERSPNLNQEDPSEPPHIKEEQEEVWISQEGEQLHGLKEEEEDVCTLEFTPVLVKSEEEDGEKAQSSQHRESQTEESVESLKTEADGEDCGGPEPGSHVETSRYSECEDDDRKWCFDNSAGFNLMQSEGVSLSDLECNSRKTPLSSTECPRILDEDEQLWKHNAVPTEVKPFRCSICSQRFSEKTSLMNHRSLHSEQKRFSCSVCNKKFHWRKDILTHMRIHTGEKPYSCSVCGKGFTQSCNLASHVKVHTGDKPFTCSVCNTRFSLRKTLDDHLRTHSGEKPFDCLVCGKRFARKGHMRRHSSVHTGEKPYSCSVCGKQFADNASLKNHSSVHTGEKPYSCSVCGKQFTHNASLKKHSSVHTREKPFGCNSCEKRFSRSEYLKKHKCVGESSRDKGSCRDDC